MRVRRTELTTPGSNVDMMRKAASSDADEVMLDLEDAVAPGEKKGAREKIVEAIESFEWGDKTIAVRINGLDTRYAYGDLTEVVEGAGEHVDVIIIPKIKRGEDVYWVDTFLDQLEADLGLDNSIGIEVLIEETEAMQNVGSIASSSDRLEALIFGPADYSASQGVNLRTLGEGDYPYPGDIWHHARNQVVIAARSNGLDAIDGPFGDVGDLEGYREQCEWAETLGFVGKWAIHPSQIEVANSVFAPSEDEIDHAKRVVEAMERGAEDGQGAIRVDGRMVDEAMVRSARQVLSEAEQIGLVEIETSEV